MNSYVDGVAKRCAKNAARGTIRKREQCCKSRTNDVSMLHSFFQCWGEMNRAALRASAVAKPKRDGTMPSFQLLVDPAALICVGCDIDDDTLASCPYGRVFACRVRDYLNGLEWDVQQAPVSLLELYFDFAISTGTVSPVFCAYSSHRGSRGVYRLPDIDVIADVQQQTLQLQSRVWHRVIKWLLPHWRNHPLGTVCQTNSLARYGYFKPHGGIGGQPRFRSNLIVCQSLWNYFHAFNGAATSLKYRWNPPRTVAESGG